MKGAVPLLAIVALTAALAAYVLWPSAPGDGPGLADPAPADNETAPGQVKAGSLPAPGRSADTFRPAAAAPPPPWLSLLAQPAGPFSPNSRDSDFAAPMPTGHEPAAIRNTADNLARWLAEPENQQAQARMIGVDCRQPPCILSVQHDLPSDPAFVGRAERWLSMAAGLGTVQMFTAPVDDKLTRQWYFFSPFEDGTPEHHQYTQAAIARVEAERKTFAYRDPSEALTGQLAPPPAQ